MNFKKNKKRINKISSFKELIPLVLKEMQIEDQYGIEELKNNWKNIVGNIIAVHSYPDKIEGTTLYIIADHSVFAQDLIMMKKIILDKLAAFYVTQTIRGLKVKIKKT